MISPQRMQQIYDGVLAQRQLQLNVGGGLSLDSVRAAFVQMREFLDIEDATQDEKNIFRQAITNAINGGRWRVADHRDRTMAALDSAFDEVPLAMALDEQVVSPVLGQPVF